MIKYTIRRFITMLFTLFIIATATFFLLAAVPGDALSSRAERLPENIKENLYKKYGLDKPILERYVITMRSMLHGDFGESITYEGQTVSSIIRDKGPVSARLGIQQMLLGVTVGLLLGVVAAIKKRNLDRLSGGHPVDCFHIGAQPGVRPSAARRCSEERWVGSR